VGDNTIFFCSQKLLGVEGSVSRCVVMVNQPGLFSPKFGTMSSHFFHAVSAKLRSRTRNSQFGLLGQILYANPLDVKESDDHALQIAFHPSGLFGPW